MRNDIMDMDSNAVLGMDKLLKSLYNTRSLFSGSTRNIDRSSCRLEGFLGAGFQLEASGCS